MELAAQSHVKPRFWPFRAENLTRVRMGRERRFGAYLDPAFGDYVDAEWYQNRYSDVSSAGAEPTQHFLHFGHKEGRSPNEFFDPAWYISNYPSIWSTTEALLNYVGSGWREGRNPGPCFDGRRYLAEYPDVASADIEPLLHYLTYGRAEGRCTFKVKPLSTSHDSRTSLDLLPHDVMSCISLTYELAFRRQASFEEVHGYFRKLALGETLPGLLRSIATSEKAGGFNWQRSAQHGRERFARAVAIAYETILGRQISEPEIDENLRHYEGGSDFIDHLINIYNSHEANAYRTQLLLPELPDGRFVQLLFELLLSRGAPPRELSHYRDQLVQGTTTRNRLLASFLGQASHSPKDEKAVVHDTSRAILFGKRHFLTLDEWNRKRREVDRENNPVSDSSEQSFPRFLFSSNATPLVSVITSLYRGGDYIGHFLENITSQSIFREHCELLIIDANSPENEYDTIREYMARFPNIKYQRFDYRLGIYEAWNVGVQNARGDYCTNANLDDCRRQDSLELQSATLDALPFVDVVYQDVLYSFEKNMAFEQIAKFGFSTKLPIVSRYNLIEFNSPHNAPMWRKKLHDEIGLFDARYRSAGDYEFWVRVRLAGKTFYKLNDPHVAYFVNPKGLSTRADTPGVAEALDISKRHVRKLVSPNITADPATFSGTVEALSGAAAPKTLDRYEIAQAALRNLSKASRKAASGDHSP